MHRLSELPLLIALPVVLLLAAAAGPPATGDPQSLPVDIEVVASTVSDDGTFDLQLACTPREDLQKIYALRVALTSYEDLVVADRVTVIGLPTYDGQ